MSLIDAYLAGCIVLPVILAVYFRRPPDLRKRWPF
jgi:hypothetical protein